MDRGDLWCQERLMQDGLHPNVQGYQSILEDILNWSPLTSFVGVDGFIQPFTGIAEK
jgi:hypothetical protein